MTLSGKLALVTGSNSGIGLAIAIELAKSGANIVLNSFTDRAEDHGIAKELSGEHKVEAKYICADLARAVEARLVVEHAGPIDILVNNAGIQHVSPIETFPTDKWDQVIAINLSSAFHTTAAALPGMRERGWGRIVNISSAHGLTASPHKSAYIAAKHGLIGLTKTVALETAEAPITCNAICPGYVLTPMVEAQIPAQIAATGLDRRSVVRDVMLARQPTKEFISPEHVAQTVVFLTSPAADQMTGTTVSVDGGWTAL